MLFCYNRSSNYTKRDCVRKISTFLLSIILISLTGCEDKKPDDTPIPIENTTEFISQPQDNSDQKTRLTINKQTKSHDDNLSLPRTNTFMLLDTKSKSQKVTLSDAQVTFHRNSKAIVIVNLFATWCPPCIGEFSYLNTLQKKYSKDLFILGVLTNDYIDVSSLESFIAKHGINYFISNSPHNNAFSGLLAKTLDLPQNFSIPLTVMYVHGKYFTHYEGSVPVEMIEYDIQQAQKQLNSKSNKN